MITPINQQDQKWGKTFIGNTRLRLDRWGCCICSLCMLLEKLRGNFCDPSNAAKYWKFNAKGEILWNTTAFNGMTFIKRSFFYNYAEIEKYANEPTLGVIIEVNHKHWLYAEKASNRKISIIDPIDGQKYNDVPTKYQITGYSIFEKDLTIPSWANEDWEEAKKLNMPFKNPTQEININEFQEILKFYGLLKETGKMPVYRANSAALKWKKEIEKSSK